MNVFSRRVILSYIVTSGLAACASSPPLKSSSPDVKNQFVPNKVQTTAFSNPPSFQGQMILTYDDGPHQTLTPRLLDILGEAGAKATFFMIGQRVKIYPSIVRRVANEGHQIGNHSWSHPELTRVSAQRRHQEISMTQKIIEDTIGIQPILFRPPYGAITPQMKIEFKRDFGLNTVMWDVDTKDYTRPGANVVSRRVLNAAPGEIVLMHDIHSPTIEATRMFTSALLS